MGRAINKENSLAKDYLAGILLILVNAVFVYIIFWFFSRADLYDEYTNWNYGFSIGGTLGCAFQIIFYISGGLTKPFWAFVRRWKDFFDDLKISFKFAISSLFESFIRDGVVFLWYILILLCTINMSAHGFLYFIELYF